MLNRFFLYFHTVKYLKWSQVLNRVRVRLGFSCPLGVAPPKSFTLPQRLETPAPLDFDPVFLARFPAGELLANRITILHSSKDFDWKTRWEFEDQTPLWNFNLHYFEYLFPLIKAWQDSCEAKYLNKTVEIIEGWIDNNPAGRKPAWSSYPTSLRLITWLSYYAYTAGQLPEAFKTKFITSLHDQYIYLSNHLEKDILGNHYFENVKSLVMAALFFNDEPVLRKALKDFKAECKEEILSDGMHFELSPMYHKIILEGVLRAAIALRSAGRPDTELESYLQPMLDAAFSFEDGLERIPLFNDGGNNVAKSLDTLTQTAKTYFNLTPHYKNKLESSGFYIFKQTADGHTWKLIVDAGKPGPEYIPGHAHCDAMSYELFRDGKPVVANCGTFAYQCKERAFFRSTAAHNTVKLNGKEQSQCWGNFRLAKRCKIRVLDCSDNFLSIEMIDANGVRCIRDFSFQPTGLEITDTAEGAELEVFVHPVSAVSIKSPAEQTEEQQPYAPEYGVKRNIACLKFKAKDRLRHRIEF